MAFWWRAAWMTLTQGIGNKIDDLSYRRFSLQLAESASTYVRASRTALGGLAAYP